VSETNADDRLPKCSFTQNCKSSVIGPCTDPQDAETPIAQLSSPKMPGFNLKELEAACPYLKGQELCCNELQIMLMYNNFKTIDSLFGNCAI
jgi:hypothetical protein